MKKPFVSIVIPTFNRKEQLVRLLQSIKDSDYPHASVEIIVVDNASDPELPITLKKILPKIVAVSSGKNLYSNGARKLGAEVAHGDYIFFLDDDNTLEKACLGALVDALEQNPTFGAVGPVMLNGDSDVIWAAGARLTGFGMCNHLYSDQEVHDTVLPKIIAKVDYFPNACMVRRTVLQKVPLDVDTFPHNWAEIDFCLRIWAAGYEIAGISTAIDRHHIGYTGKLTRFRSATIYDQAKSRILFRKRHLPKLSHWAWFWGVIFPLSSLVYFKRILRSSDSKLTMLRSYIRGTYDGVTTATAQLPEVNLSEENS